MRFTVFAAGREAGHESVFIRRKAGTVRLKSSAKLSRDERSQELELEAELDEAGRLRSFRALGVQGGRERVVTMAASDGMLVGEIREGERARAVELAVGEETVFLAEPFTAPYLLLASRYDRARGGSQTFPAVFPLEGRAGRVTLVMEEEQALEIDGRAELARLFRVRPDRGDVANLWLDAEGDLLVCARSVAGLSAVRGHAIRFGLRPGEDPPDPEGVASVRIRFSAPEVTLAGTVTKPTAGPARCPAVVLLSGSGPQDRNGNAPGTELQWNHLHSIAVELARAGIASLRFDERGVGTSSGRFYDAGVAELVSDARSAVDYLRSREDVDPHRIGLVGHSEGALLAAMLAGEEGADFRALALLGAPAEPLDLILLGQVERRLVDRGSPEQKTQRILGELRAFFEHVRLASGDAVTFKGRTREARWLREHMAISPERVYSGVRCPTLVLHGGRDAQVPAAQARIVQRALGRHAAGLLLFETLDHFLMPSRGDLNDYAETSRRVAGEALSRLSSWLETAL